MVSSYAFCCTLCVFAFSLLLTNVLLSCDLMLYSRELFDICKFGICKFERFWFIFATNNSTHAKAY